MDDCIFCKIIKKEIPAEIILDKETFLVIKDIAPKAPIHYLLLPKKHIESLLQVDNKNCEIITDMILATKDLAKKFGLDSNKRGYKIIINTGAEGGQEVMHLHFHFLGGQ